MLAPVQFTVTDLAGNVVPDADIELRLETTGSIVAVFADKEGETGLGSTFQADGAGYVLVFVEPGEYRIDASKDGFTRTWRYVPINFGAPAVTIPDIGVTVQPYDADTVKRDVANTFTAKQTFAATAKLQQALEKVAVIADNPASGDNDIDALTQAIVFYTTANDANFGLNVRGDGSTALNSVMAVNESLTIAVMVTNTGTAYYLTGIKIDGNAVTPKWLNGDVPSAGNINAIDLYLITIIKTADATFTVLTQRSKWA